MHHVSLNISVYDLEKTLYFEWDYIFIKIDLYVAFNIHISVICESVLFVYEAYAL